MERNSRGYPTLASLPPAEAVPNKAIASAIQTYTERQQAFQAEVVHIRELDSRVARGQAIRRDQEAYAAALRKGAADPGRKVEDALDAGLAAANRKRAALELACAADAEDLRAALAKHGPELAELCQQRFASALADVSAALASMGEAWSRAVQARSLGEWAKSGGQYLVREPALLVGSGTTRTSTTFGEILSALNDELTVDASPEPTFLVEPEEVSVG